MSLRESDLTIMKNIKTDIRSRRLCLFTVAKNQIWKKMLYCVFLFIFYVKIIINRLTRFLPRRVWTFTNWIFRLYHLDMN